jgi:aminomethyltransferase
VTAGGREAGVVSSGTSSPSLKAGVALAFVDAHLKEPGTGVQVMIRNRAAAAEVSTVPFYKKKRLETSL